MKSILYLLIMLIYIPVYAQISKPTEYITQAFDVISYSARLDLSSGDMKKVLGQCEIKIRLKSKLPEDKIYLHLAELRLDSILFDQKNISYLKTGDQIDIKLQDLSSNELADTISLLVFYKGTMKNAPNNDGWGGVISRSNIVYAMGVGFKNPDVSATRYWMPCYDHPSDKAEFEAVFIVPAGKTVASIGKFDVQYTDNGKDIYTFTHDYPVASYLMTFAIGDYVLQETNYGELPINVYTLPQDTTSSKYYYKKVPEITACFEKYFGKYPFEKIGYVNTPTGSMEHQTMISMDVSIIRSAIANKDSLAETAAHELAHQWFGNMITPYDFRDAWLNEGFASYSESLWTEENFGYGGYLNKITNDINSYLNYSKTEGILSLYDFYRGGNSSNYPLTIYKKGSAVISLLRYKLGDEKFFAGLKNYIEKYKYDNTTTEDLRASFEETAGTSLQTFFDEWVYSKGYPILEITFDKYLNSGVDSVNVTFRQIQADSIPVFTDLPVELSFLGADAKLTHQIFNISEKEQTFKLYNLPATTNIFSNKGQTVRTLMSVKPVKYLSVDETTANHVRIYPNPAGQKINVQYSAQSNNVSFNLYSILGIQMFETTFETSDSNYLLNLPKLSAGNYVLVITDGDKKITERVVVGNQ